YIPPAWSPDSGGGTFGTTAAVAGAGISGTIHFFLLPYIEQGPLYNKFNPPVANQPTVYTTIVKTVICPSDTTYPGNIGRYGYASTNYAANLKVFNPKGKLTIANSMPDGTANTVIWTERFKQCTPSWGGQTDPQWAMHPAYVGH